MNTWYYLSRDKPCRPLPDGPYVPKQYEDPTCPGTGGGASSWDDLTGKPTVFPPEDHTHVWDDITDPPDCFPPCTHTHVWDDITDPPECFTPCAHTHPWGEITDLPSCFVPCAHTHDWSDVTNPPTFTVTSIERGLITGGGVYNAESHRIQAPPPSDDADIGIVALDGGTP